MIRVYSRTGFVTNQEIVMRKYCVLSAIALSAMLAVPAVSGEIIHRAGERPREMPNKCSQYPDDRYYGVFQGIGQIGIFLDKPIYEGGCFPTKKRCDAWLYAIRSDHGAGKQLANCRPR